MAFDKLTIHRLIAMCGPVHMAADYTARATACGELPERSQFTVNPWMSTTSGGDFWDRDMTLVTCPHCRAKWYGMAAAHKPHRQKVYLVDE